MSESDLINRSSAMEVIKKHDFTMRKKYGQNFLTDARVLDKILDASGTDDSDTVIEIGPGIGTMTQALARIAKKVIAIEIDDKLIPILGETLAPYDNIKLVHADVMKLDLNKLVEEENDGQPVRVVANLPYYITTPVLMKFLEDRVPMKSMTVMVQQEVADRMAAAPGSDQYGALSLAVQYYSKPYLAAHVPPNCFIPRPKVGSAVVSLECYEEPPVSVKDEKLMFALIRASFNQRRKTMVNAVANYPELAYTKEDVAAALAEMALSPTVRGEALSLIEFARLSDILGRKQAPDLRKDIDNE
ncbi:MAG: 16S rRNA (adenine(1518)-N(6)/adenine(1519)-N(6))-dimethyltransferase RsmA [Lachnospiraceae bacterium]|nr:16S rRNA (adenine(1518)-N(6)/adenine(1519)-N(6))-dimethyltransferase RsmA [Lachnospiraceae bacterium]